MSKYKLTKLQETWLATLEAGTYKKAREYLCRTKSNGTPIGYCCLGIACEVYNNTSKKKKLPVRHTEGSNHQDYDGRSGNLPDDVMKAFKFYTDSGRLMPQDSKRSLAQMNDNGWSHKEIAEFIRANPEQVFQK